LAVYTVGDKEILYLNNSISSSGKNNWCVGYYGTGNIYDSSSYKHVFSSTSASIGTNLNITCDINLTGLLNGYYTSTEVDTLFNSYYTSTEIDTLIAGYHDKTYIDSLISASGLNTKVFIYASGGSVLFPKFDGSSNNMVVKDAFVQINPITYLAGNTYSQALHQFNGNVYFQANLLGPSAPYKKLK
jgi:hypothetical protein